MAGKCSNYIAQIVDFCHVSEVEDGEGYIKSSQFDTIKQDLKFASSELGDLNESYQKEIELLRSTKESYQASKKEYDEFIVDITEKKEEMCVFVTHREREKDSYEREML